MNPRMKSALSAPIPGRWTARDAALVAVAAVMLPLWLTSPAAGPAAAQQPSAGTQQAGGQMVADPNADWPCVQHKVPNLTAAQMWDGPAVDDKTGWREDSGLSKLVPVLTSRRVPMEEAEKAIETFAKSVPEAERDEKLTLLFAGVLAETNLVRRQVIEGIENFQRRQRDRAARLEEQGIEIAKLHKQLDAGEKVSLQLDTLQNQYDWNARVFKERQDNLPLACEIPVLIEQRVFGLAQAIRAQMS